MKTKYVLVDYENVHVKSLAVLDAEQFRWWIFLGPKNTRLEVPLVLAVQELRERATYVTLKSGGSNALDFHIAYYLGTLVTADPTGSFHIISKDTGFDPLIRHLKAHGIAVSRSVSIETLPGSRSVAKTGLPQDKTDEKSVNEVIADLVKRKAARPRTRKTLLNTIHAKLGKNLDMSRIEAVYEILVQQGYVKTDGLKVSYNLPTPESQRNQTGEFEDRSGISLLTKKPTD